MFSLSSTVFDRTGTLQRLPNPLDDSDWAGDHLSDYENLELDIDVRVELSDIETWTVWMQSKNEPHNNDRILVDGLDLTLYVIRAKPWTRFGGDFHHYELVTKETPETRKFSDDG